MIIKKINYMIIQDIKLYDNPRYKQIKYTCEFLNAFLWAYTVEQWGWLRGWQRVLKKDTDR